MGSIINMRRFPAGNEVSKTDRTARNIGSGFNTIPLPPPNGVSSTCLCLSNAKSRSWIKFISKIPLSRARLIILSSSGANIFGNKVIMSIRMIKSPKKYYNTYFEHFILIFVLYLNKIN